MLTINSLAEKSSLHQTHMYFPKYLNNANEPTCLKYPLVDAKHNIYRQNIKPALENNKKTTFQTISEKYLPLPSQSDREQLFDHCFPGDFQTKYETYAVPSSSYVPRALRKMAAKQRFVIHSGTNHKSSRNIFLPLLFPVACCFRLWGFVRAGSRTWIAMGGAHYVSTFRFPPSDHHWSLSTEGHVCQNSPIIDNRLRQTSVQLLPKSALRQRQTNRR
jgi:hypothetical protein